MSARRRKTPETPVSARIRAYATTYEAGGQKERAEGMRQAADMVDELSRRGGDVTWLLRPDAGEMFSPREVKERIEALEKTVGQLMILVGKPASLESPQKEYERRPRNGGLSPKETTAALLSDTALSPGEERALAAIAQHASSRAAAAMSGFGFEGLSNDDLTALIDYRATSLTTYLSTLRAAGYVETVARRHFATEAGKDRVKSFTLLPRGLALFSAWMDRLPAGEAKILGCVGPSAAVSDVRSLVGDRTGLKATSVSTYVAKLIGRRLLVRSGHGKIRLAPILLDSDRGLS